VVEGVQTAQEVRALAQKYDIDMPISEQVWRVLYDGRDPHLAVRTLLAREQKPENV
jgi:glycerol-3-phosphate dehydrogenase (NAD(P)+)